ncbi:MAG: S1 RNA-binding domain-containing protein [bacterium]|nr:S1 RNA-binding domain-containing protein [bacterium]
MTEKKTNTTLSALLKSDAGIIKILKVGEFAEGTLIKKGKKVAYFDLGSLGTGVIFGIEYLNGSEMIKGLKVGDKISGRVVDTENEDGYVELSLTEAGRQKIWAELKDIRDKNEPITVKITGANSGGLMTEVSGMKAFLPVSQLSNDHYPRVTDGNKEKILEELKKMVGMELKVKIINNNQNLNKLIVSEREIADQGVKELLNKYKVGDIIDGIISGVADFGAFIKFVDQPAVEGLIHISEIDHRLIENPKEVLKINDAVRAKIVEIKEGRVSLSLKALKPNPWDTIAEKLKEGQETLGTVSRFNPFGAFVALDHDIQGLIHVSEFGGVDEMKKAIELGKQYRFRIESMKPAEKRIILKLVKN